MAENDRPTPEQMLARLKAEGDEHAVEARRGKLKVFFGYAAGVGKTYAMLQEAQRLKESGTDVVAGYVEPHGRPETEVLLEGQEQLPLLKIPYRGTTLSEFDLDAALGRRPEVLLVDELAHTNAPGMRHAKRWQDLEELLNAGIDVHTTCNVQHVESLNDVIAQISGVIVRETVPDDVFRRADELTLIDLSPEDLLQRLREGKVYIPTQAQRALQNFFRKENLVALRELALRRVTERVHADVETARTGRGAGEIWATGEKLLVCVGPSPSSARVLRAAKRLANSLQAELIAVHVENAATEQMSDKDRRRLLAHLRLAERLGAETVTLAGDDLVAEALAFAKQRNVTKIVIGKSEPRRHWFRQTSTITDRLIHDSGEIDVYVIRGGGEPVEEAAGPNGLTGSLRATTTPFKAWVGTTAILGLCTALALLLNWLDVTEANLVMTYLLGVVCVALRYGRWPSIAASIGAVLLFDVLFTTPYYTLVVHDAQYLVTFMIMLLVGLTIAELTTRIRRSAWQSQRNARRTEALYQLGRKLSGISGQDFLALETERAVAEIFDGQAVVFLPQDGHLRPILGHPASFAANASEVAVAQWVFDHETIAGRGTGTLPAAQATYFPLVSPQGALAVLGIQTEDVEKLASPDSRRLFEAYASQVALALERDRLTLESHEASIKAETERLRNTLLSSVSHDLRTPLAVISGASSSLLQSDAALNESTRRELLETIFEESDRLARLVENLLRLTQLSSGRFEVHKQWHPVEDVIGSALRRLEHTLADRPVNVKLPAEILQGQFDAVLVEQVLVNLFENACRYTPPATAIDIVGRREGRKTILEIADRGPGLTAGDEQRIFDKFQRGRHANSDSRGTGLGLAICHAIMEAHGGRISARNRDGGGAVFRLEFVASGSPPRCDTKFQEDAEETRHV